jgi:hypothetical protein
LDPVVIEKALKLINVGGVVATLSIGSRSKPCRNPTQLLYTEISERRVDVCKARMPVGVVLGMSRIPVQVLLVDNPLPPNLL